MVRTVRDSNKRANFVRRQRDGNEDEKSVVCDTLEAARDERNEGVACEDV